MNKPPFIVVIKILHGKDLLVEQNIGHKIHLHLGHSIMRFHTHPVVSIFFGDIDLEDAMMSPEEEEKQTEKSKKDMDESGTYGKVYMKTHEKRGERSVS